MKNFTLVWLLPFLITPSLFAVQDSAMMNFSAPSIGKNAETYSHVIDEATHFLNLIDQSQYNSAWSDSGPIMRAIIPMEIWTEGVRYFRNPLGFVQSREVVSHENLISLPGAVSGNYYRILFRTQFFGGRSKNETLILSAEGLGRWRVISYNIH